MAIYRDLNSFSPTVRPMLKDVEVIYQSIFNIFNTRIGEFPFNPEFGIDLENELFELIDEATAFSIYGRIVRAVQRWERRALVDMARTTVTPFPDENRYEIEIYFKISGLGEQVFEYRGNFVK